MVAEHKITNRQILLRVLGKSRALSDDVFASLKAAKTADEAADIIEANLDVKGMSRTDLKAVWNTKPEFDTKKVMIEVSADAGEEVEVTAPEAAPDEAAAMDEDEEPVEKARPEPKPKSRSDFGPRLARAAVSRPESAVSRAEKAYDLAVKNGRTHHGLRPRFDSGEQASAFGAWFRTVLADGREYPMKAFDREILGKAHVEYDNSLGGALVPDDFVPNLIDVKNEFGAFRRAAGVTTMSRETLTMPRIASDAVVDWVGEASTQTAQSTPTFDLVTLVARKAGAYFTVSNELINDSAVNIADVLALSVGRGFGEFEDDSALLGQNDTVGINDLIPPASASTAIYDAALSSSWSDYTQAKITAWLGKVPDAAWRKGTVSIVCSVNFYHSVLLSLAQSAGGTLPGDILGGVGGRFRARAQGNADATFDGIPVYFTSSAPTTYSGNQAVAWAGAFDLGAKFGEVSGSNGIATSEHVAFASDQLGVRALERVAINLHDIQDDASSMVITLKD